MFGLRLTSYFFSGDMRITIDLVSHFHLFRFTLSLTTELTDSIAGGS